MQTKDSDPALQPQKAIGGQGDFEATIKKLRRQIDEIDWQVVDLLADRQAVVEQVVALKKKHNLSVYHPAREENLISDRRDQGKKAGLNPNYVEELYRCILRQSRVEQTAQMARSGLRAGASVLIVGGRGCMGRYFRSWFEDAGYRVRILDRQDWPRVRQLCAEIDLALISVPIDLTADVVHEIGPYLPPDCVLADITSIKQPPLTAMLEAHLGPVVGLHPLFGPTTSTLDKQIVVVTPGRNHDACRWLIDQLAAWGAVIVGASAREHDDIMGIVQALRHFATFAFGQFLHRRHVDLPRTLEFSSPIYRLELGMVGRLFAQDASLYSEIIFASPQRRALLKDYLACLTGNLNLLESGDKDSFCAEFKKIAEWFGPFSEQALRESTYLIDKLIERF
jgi:chorismate mutase/prephenate dehydrogenase